MMDDMGSMTGGMWLVWSLLIIVLGLKPDKSLEVRIG